MRELSNRNSFRQSTEERTLLIGWVRAWLGRGRALLSKTRSWSRVWSFDVSPVDGSGPARSSVGLLHPVLYFWGLLPKWTKWPQTFRRFSALFSSIHSLSPTLTITVSDSQYSWIWFSHERTVWLKRRLSCSRHLQIILLLSNIPCLFHSCFRLTCQYWIKDTHLWQSKEWFSDSTDNSPLT